ncbi:hypothetical protein QBC34DRAFT_8796 [Podospora aff. communis PSN243]|uniref:Uncharacterized protein n=1 Tax=Podospora aff. communis PSN243 TaxID=3040156 RepID=A0AAV9H840_9PEZI|nr:hypothetical protein QBC34DRAFT_8796 [Podospora aff. communis PSN243]
MWVPPLGNWATRGRRREDFNIRGRLVPRNVPAFADDRRCSNLRHSPVECFDRWRHFVSGLRVARLADLSSPGVGLAQHAAADDLPSRYGRRRLAGGAGPVYAASRYLGLALARGPHASGLDRSASPFPMHPLQPPLPLLLAAGWVQVWVRCSASGNAVAEGPPPYLVGPAAGRRCKSKFHNPPFLPPTPPLPLLVDPRL